MKTITLLFAAVIITSGAIATNTFSARSAATQSISQTSTIANEVSASGNGGYHSSRYTRRNYKHHLKLTLKNPFRIIGLNRSTRY